MIQYRQLAKNFALVDHLQNAVVFAHFQDAVGEDVH